MKRAARLLILVLTVAILAPFSTAAGEPAARVKIVSVDELALADAAAEIAVDDTQVLFPVPGRPKSAFYIVAKISRELPEGAADVLGSAVTLGRGSDTPVPPSAVAAVKRALDGDKPSYPAADKKRWVSETLYFPWTAGRRDWTIALDGKTLASAADWYVTLIVRNLGTATARLKLPDGSQPELGGDRTQTFQFVAGQHDLVIEVRGKGKVALPWKKYDRGETKYAAVITETRHAPILPADALRKALPKINKAWQMFHNQKGIGGGGYNISTREAPVQVYCEFGKDGVQGGITRCESDRISISYRDESAPAKGRKAPTEPFPIRYGWYDSGAWKVEPWDKAERVEITEDAKKVVGETTVGRFVIRSTEKAPSLWSEDGLFDKGILWDKDLGTFKAEAKKQDEIYLVWGTEAK